MYTHIRTGTINGKVRSTTTVDISNGWYGVVVPGAYRLPESPAVWRL